MFDMSQIALLVDIIIALVVIEAIALLALRSTLGHGPHVLGLLCNLAAGGALMMALRAAIAEHGAMTIAAWLSVSLVVHVADLWIRWRDAGLAAQRADTKHTH